MVSSSLCYDSTGFGGPGELDSLGGEGPERAGVNDHVGSKLLVLHVTCIDGTPRVSMMHPRACGSSINILATGQVKSKFEC